MMTSAKMTKTFGSNSNSKTILVMAGGTGGHIFPGLAVADELKAKGWQIHWLGTADKMEAQIVPAHGYDISFITISGLRNKGLWRLFLLPYTLIKSVLQARKVIKTIKPDVVLGMGGYASAPGGIAAWLSKVPLIIHEQNAAAGMSNRLLARFANKVCCAFPQAFAGNINAEVVGNPLRSTIGQGTTFVNKEDEISQSKSSLQSKNILVVGGSLGAQVLNEVVPCSYSKLFVNDHSYKIWHQTGAGKKEKVDTLYSAQSVDMDSIKVTEFIKDIAAAYEWADIVICRAGALTVSELAMAATPAIFIPLPHAVDDHQTKNALYLVDRGAARLLPQPLFNEQSLYALIVELFDSPITLESMRKAALSAANNDAREKVATLCQQLALAPDTESRNNEEKI